MANLVVFLWMAPVAVLILSAKLAMLRLARVLKQRWPEKFDELGRPPVEMFEDGPRRDDALLEFIRTGQGEAYPDDQVREAVRRARRLGRYLHVVFRILGTALVLFWLAFAWHRYRR